MINSFSRFSFPDSCQDTRVLKQKLRALKKLVADLEGTDKQICLFIARRASQDVPQADNEIWVSLDRCPEKEPCGRIHLHLNFNNPKLMAKIAQTFDKVVLDWSSLKFFDEDPWRTMAKLLKPHPDAMLITEAVNPQPGHPVSHYTERQYQFGECEILEDRVEQMNQLEQTYLRNLKESVSEAEWEERYLQFLQNNPDLQKNSSMPERIKRAGFEQEILQQAKKEGKVVVPAIWEEAELNAKEAASKYLQTFFESVELVESQPWPYASNYGSTRGYFILKNLKQKEV